MEYGDPRWLSELQTTLAVGYFFLVVLAFMVWDRGPQKPDPRKVEQCKLHQRPLSECPPGSHDA